jgi:hypothetical protein
MSGKGFPDGMAQEAKPRASRAKNGRGRGDFMQETIPSYAGLPLESMKIRFIFVRLVRERGNELPERSGRHEAFRWGITHL